MSADPVEALTAALNDALEIVEWQGAAIEAAKKLVETVMLIHAKSGEPVFAFKGAADDVASATLNHRFTDLTALLNRTGRPVPPRLTEGALH